MALDGLNTDITIRRAENGDVNRVASFHEKVWAQVYLKIAPVVARHVFDKKDLLHHFKMAISKSHHALWLLEGPDKLLTGYAHASVRKTDRLCELKAIYLAQDFLQKGYGRRLLSQIFTWAKVQRSSHLVVWVIDQNVDAKKFYEKTGALLVAQAEKISTVHDSQIVEVCYEWKI